MVERGVRELWLGAACAGSMLLGCEVGSPIDVSGTPVAWIDGDPIAIEEVRGRAAGQTAEQRRALVDRAIEDRLAEQEARRRGLAYSEGVIGRLIAIRRAAALREREVLRAALRESVTWDPEVSEADVRAYYDARKDLYRTRRVVLRIATFDQEAAATAAAAALDASAALDFELKEVGPTPVHSLAPPLREAVRELLAEGEHAVVADGASWSLVVLASDSQLPAAFEEVRETLTERVRRRREQSLFDAEIERLRAAVEIRIEQGVLERDAVWRPDR